jgi:hypothetical protein
MKNTKFKDIEPGQRFWNKVHEHENATLVEHLRLYDEDSDGYNAVELNEGRLCYFHSNEDVKIIEANDVNPVNVEFKTPDGNVAPQHKRAQTVGCVDQFTIAVESINGIGVDSLKNQLQKKFKVSNVKFLRKTFTVV